nr:putative glycoprotein [Chuviridae sp.]
MRVIVFAAMVCSVQGLVGYDCQTEKTNMTAVSLSSVSSCPSRTEIEAVTHVRIQLVQERNVDQIAVTSCLVERSYILYHCGMHSHSSMAHGGFRTREVRPVGREECATLHRHGTMSTMGGTVLTGFKVNSSSTLSVTEMGRVDAGSGSCKGADFILGGVSYSDVVMQSSYTVTLHSERAVLDIGTGMVKLSSGYSLKFHDRTGFDADLGYVYWETAGVNVKCSPTSYVVVFEGDARVYKDRSGRRTLVVNTTSQVMAVGMGSHTLLCHQPALETDHPRLFVMTSLGPDHGFYFQKGHMDPREVDLFLYTNSKLVYVEQHLAQEITAAYWNLHRQICDVRHQLLTQLTTLAFVAPEEFAWAYTKRPGVTAVVRGEVVYVIECKAVSVEFRQTSSCFQEVPIVHNGSNAFLKPRSRIITQYGSEIDCSPLAPPLFFLGGQWVSLVPFPTPTPEPVILDATYPDHWVYTSPPHLVATGLYSSETLRKYQRQLMFPIERAAIENTVAASMAGLKVDAQNLDASTLLQRSGLDKLQHDFMSRIHGWWWSFSVNLAGIMGVIFIIALLKTVGNFVLNGAFLYKTFGCSVKLLALFWGTLAKFLLIHPPGQEDSSGVPLMTQADSTAVVTEPQTTSPRDTPPSAVMYPEVIVNMPRGSAPTPPSAPATEAIVPRIPGAIC